LRERPLRAAPPGGDGPARRPAQAPRRPAPRQPPRRAGRDAGPPPHALGRGQPPLRRRHPRDDRRLLRVHRLPARPPRPGGADRRQARPRPADRGLRRREQPRLRPRLPRARAPRRRDRVGPVPRRPLRPRRRPRHLRRGTPVPPRPLRPDEGRGRDLGGGDGGRRAALAPVGEPLVVPGRPLACCVEAPDAYRAKARYAVEELLRGLGLAPRWVDREGLGDGGLYYGLDPEAVPGAALRFRLAPETAAFFAAPRPFDPARAGTLTWDGTAWPLLFDPSTHKGQTGGEGTEDRDVFASAFFWLSGWDEAATRARDRHGRFVVEDALLARLDPALPPLVDVYRAWLGERLAVRGVAVPGRTWGGRTWAVALTVDVDVVRTRRLGRLARGLAAGQVGEALRALAPGDARRQALHDFQAAFERWGARATWFFKAGAATPEDAAYRLEAPRLRRL